jgi:hypothetical protein
MLTVSRRGLLALGGTGVATVLAGCGSEPDPRAEGDDQQLLTNAYAAEVDLQTAYDTLSRGGVGGDDSATVIARSQRASSERQAELGKLGASAGQSQSDGGSADGADTGLGLTEAAANAAIAAYRQCAGLLPEAADRATTMGFLAQVAAELAAIRGLFGKDQAPEAFVTGGSEQPFVAAAETTTTSTTSTSTTTTDEQ